MRGFDEEDFREVGRIIAGALGDGADLAALAAAARRSATKRPLYPGFRGYTTLRRRDDRASSRWSTHPLVQHKLVATCATSDDADRPSSASSSTS